MVVEKKYGYTTTVKQPQKVCGILLNPKGGVLTERELKAIKKDPYGASLLEKKLLVVDTEPAPEIESGSEGKGETIPDLEERKP